MSFNRLREFSTTSPLLIGICFPFPPYLHSLFVDDVLYLQRGFGTLAATAASPSSLVAAKTQTRLARCPMSVRCPRSLTSGQRDQWGAAFET